MQTVLCLNFFDDAHYYYLDQVLGASATGYEVLKDVMVTATWSMFGLKSIFSTNKDVTGFHAWDSPKFDSK